MPPEWVESNFRLLMDAAPDAMLVANDAGLIVLANLQAEKLFGYSREQLIGKSLEVLVPPALREKHVQHRHDFFQDAQPRPMGVGLQLSARRGDGSEVPVEISLSPLSTGDEKYVTAAIRDISERKKTEAILRDKEESIRLLVECVEDYAIFMLDPTGHVMNWNSGAECIKGYKASEIVGRHFSCFYPKEDIERGKPDWELHHAAAEGRIEDEGWRLRKDGSRFWADVIITALRDPDGKLRGFSKVTRDITQRKHAEEALAEQRTALALANTRLIAANKELESFSYSVSHDLRAPLRQIDGFSKILLDEAPEALPSEQREYLQEIRQGAQHLGQLVDDLLNFSRLGRQALIPQVVSVSALVRSVVSEIQRDLEGSGREVEWQVGSLPDTTCDSTLLRQVFRNLVSNAVKFTKTRPKATIEIGCTNSDQRPTFFVRDNGVGFDMKYAEKLFGVFQRLHLQEEFEGTGVGLAIVQRIILKHGGKVWADAKHGSGATFFFTLCSGVSTSPPTAATSNEH